MPATRCPPCADVCADADLGRRALLDKAGRLTSLLGLGLSGLPQVASAQLDTLLLGPDALGRLAGGRRLDEVRDRVFDPAAPALGNPAGPALMALFTDWRCPACRELDGRFAALLAASPDVRILVRPWPIFGAVSVTAATAALAAARQGAFTAINAAFFAARLRRDADVWETAAGVAGLDQARLRADAADPAIALTLTAIRQQAAELGLTGTPVLVAGRSIAQGAVEDRELRALAREARGWANRPASPPTGALPVSPPG